MNQKLVSSSRYNDTLPFTEMSKGALDIYKRQYGNVYEKGALINLCLDVLIRSESNGEQGLKDIIGKLLQKYGKKNSFNDDDLFEDITSMTSPKIGEFFSNYVAGSKLLPYKEILDKIGIDVKKLPYNAIDLGEISMGFDPQTHRLKVIKVDSTNEIIKELGLKTGDEPIAVNDVKISFSNVRKIFGSVKNPARIGDKLEIEAARPDGNGKFENVKLTAKVSKVKTNYETAFLINKSPSEQQLKIRNAWLGK
jgi:predicted metalloprotease with PDZ domain